MSSTNNPSVSQVEDDGGANTNTSSYLVTVDDDNDIDGSEIASAEVDLLTNDDEEFGRSSERHGHTHTHSNPTQGQTHAHAHARTEPSRYSDRDGINQYSNDDDDEGIIKDDYGIPGEDVGVGDPSGRNMYYDDDNEDDDDGIYIDDEIVKSVLESSEERFRARDNNDFRKCCIYGVVGIAIMVFMAIIVDSDLLMRGYIQHQGTAYPFNDREDYRGSDVNETLSDEEYSMSGTEFEDTMKYVAHYDNAVDVKGPAFQPSMGEVPFLFTKGSESPMVEEALSKCLGLVIAGNKPGPFEFWGDQLVTHFLDKETNDREYVNVDLTSVEGVQRAADLKLTESGLPDLILSNYLHMGLDALFHNETKARLFMVMKHPVDLAVSIYYDFTQTAVEEVLRSMSLEEFINSNYYVGNVITKIIWHGWGPENPSLQNLHIAQDILRSKFLVGIYDDLWASIQLFEDYFFWNEIGNEPETLSCKRELQRLEVQRELDMYRQIGEVKIGGAVYNRIIELNNIDMELYWFAVDLHRAQRAWIPKNSI